MSKKNKKKNKNITINDYLKKHIIQEVLKTNNSINLADIIVWDEDKNEEWNNIEASLEIIIKTVEKEINYISDRIPLHKEKQKEKEISNKCNGCEHVVKEKPKFMGINFNELDNTL